MVHGLAQADCLVECGPLFGCKERKPGCCCSVLLQCIALHPNARSYNVSSFFAVFPSPQTRRPKHHLHSGRFRRHQVV